MAGQESLLRQGSTGLLTGVRPLSGTAHFFASQKSATTTVSESKRDKNTHSCTKQAEWPRSNRVRLARVLAVNQCRVISSFLVLPVLAHNKGRVDDGFSSTKSRLNIR